VTTDARDPGSDLARLLVTAQETRSPLESLLPELVPVDAAAAFAVQQRTLALRRQAIGGWKVGAKSLAGPIQGAPLPAERILKSGAVVPREDYPLLGLELEIVPDADPTVRVGPFRGRILYCGQPLHGALVVAMPQTNPQARLTARQKRAVDSGQGSLF